jgi:hypothetical protein
MTELRAWLVVALIVAGTLWLLVGAVVSAVDRSSPVIWPSGDGDAVVVVDDG